MTRIVERYHQYRSYGHGRFMAASIAIPTKPALIAAVVVGIIAGAIL